MNVPILLLVWKRPSHTKRVIDSIKQISPKKIYISSDGPIINDKENKRLIELVRKIIFKEIDWDCQVFTNFSKVNKGCKIAVAEGINWFFSNEEEGIIIEDDCVPSKDFFYFCELLLEKYRYDERIWSICGNGYQNDLIKNKESYFFSKYADVWGWATWRRCWQFYDPDIKSWNKNRKKSLLKDLFKNVRELNYWNKIFDDLYYKQKPNTWDYQWQYLCFINSGMSCMPFTNLVENIGFGKDATHTNEDPLRLHSNLKNIGRINFPLKHPSKFSVSKECDKKLQKIFYSGYSTFSLKGLIINLKKIFFKLIKIFKKIIILFHNS